MSLVSPSQSAAGETIDAADINTPINQISAVVNGNLDDSNIASVSGTKISDGTIATAKIANAAVTNAKLASGATRLGINKVNTSAVVADTYTTYSTVTATSTGRECEVEFWLSVANLNSGANRTIQARVQCDGVDVAPIDLTQYLFYVSGASNTTLISFLVSSTPAAGSHTWTLQLKASAASTVGHQQLVMKVSEIA